MQTRVAVLAAGLLWCCMKPSPYVILKIEDPTHLADDAVAVWVGEDRDNLGRIPLGGHRFPTTVALTSERAEEVAAWVDAIGPDGYSLARGRATLTFRATRAVVARVQLLAACESAETGARCVLETGIAEGSCVAGQCVAPLWTRTVAGQTHASDIGTGIATDANGDVLVTAEMDWVIGGAANAWVARYDADGALLWDDYYNTVANATDQANEIVVTPDGHVMVGGVVAQSGQTDDIFVQKLDSATGESAWITTYNGPAGNGYDRLLDMDLDANGSIIATGWSSNPNMPWSFWLGKFDANGELIAVRTESDACPCVEAYGVAVEPSGSALVTGVAVGASLDACVCRCAQTTDSLGAATMACDWGASMDSGGLDHDFGMNVAVLSDDSYVLVGAATIDPARDIDIWVARFSFDGTMMWDDVVGGDAGDMARGVAVDSADNIVVAGSTNMDASDGDAWIGKYDASGTLLWSDSRTHAGFSNVGVDAAGNVIVVGVHGVFVDEEILVTKYDPAGVELWTHEPPGALEGGTDWGFGAAVDPSGNVFVSGVETIVGHDRNIWARKLDADGIEQWTARYNSDQDDEYNAPRALDVGSDGSVVVVGTAFIIGPGHSPWLRKYDQAGAVVWIVDPADERQGHMPANDVAVAGDGAIWVTGHDGKTDFDKNDVWMAKYDSDGKKVWSQTMDESGLSDAGMGVDTDSAGNAVFVATLNIDDPLQEAPTIWIGKLDGTDQSLLWQDRCCSDESGGELAAGVFVDSEDNVLVAGYALRETADIWVRKYGADGVELWTRTYDSGGTDAADGIAADGAGNVVVVGYVSTLENGTDAWIRKIDSRGNEIWTQTYDGSAHRHDAARDVAVDPWDNILVTGSETMDDGTTDIWIRKYVQ